MSEKNFEVVAKSLNQTMIDRIQELMDATISFAEMNINGENRKVKLVESLSIIVKVNRNLYKSEFMNHDICQVIAETENNKVVLKRLNDGHLGIADKDEVSYPKWEAYPFK